MVSPNGFRSMREERLAQGLLEGKTQTAASVDAGYSAVRGGRMGSEKMRDVDFREALRAYAHSRGIGVEYAVERLENLMHMNQSALGGREKDQVIELGPDGATRAKGVDMLLKVLGAYPDPRADVNVNAGAILVIRPENALAAADPFDAVIDCTPGPLTKLGGTDVLPAPETSRGEALTRHDIDSEPS